MVRPPMTSSSRWRVPGPTNPSGSLRGPVSAHHTKRLGGCDSRHGELVLLAYDEVSERRFAGWTMGQANLSRLNPGTVLKYSERSVLDPYQLTGQATLALFEELVQTAVIDCSP